MTIKSPANTRGTIQYFKHYTWWSILRRTINGKPQWTNANKSYLNRGIRIEFTKEQFYQWCEEHTEEILKLYTQGETPSIDRINDNLHYTLNNIQILSLKLNILHGAIKGGCINSITPHVRQLTSEQVLQIRKRITLG